VYTDQIERWPVRREAPNRSPEREVAFFAILRKHGLLDEEIMILYLRYFCGYGWDEIAADHGYADKNAARYLGRRALRVLRERNFAFPKRRK
jgi:hypothetical protein